MKKINELMTILGAEKIEEKGGIVEFSSKKWLKQGLSEKFVLVPPKAGEKDLRDRSVNAFVYLYANNFMAVTKEEKEIKSTLKGYVKSAIFTKSNVDEILSLLQGPSTKKSKVNVNC